MSIGLRTNIAAANAIRRLDLAGRDLSSTFNRLSSGLRIVNPSDDAAGLSIGTALKSDARVYAQGIRNVNDGISVLNTAEGALTQLSAIMIRQKELAEQAANGVYSSRQRVALQAESNALTKEFNRIIRVTTFGGNQIIDGTGDSFSVQQGYGINESTLLAIGQALGFAAGDATFRATMSQNMGLWYSDSITSGDVNGDGIVDVVYTEHGFGTIVVGLGNGDGTFRAPNTQYWSGSSGTNGVILADVNNDGKLDIVTGGSRVNILLGNGDGSFKTGVSYGNNSASEVVLGDFNGDGIVDLARARPNGAAILLGNGDGTYRAEITIAGVATLSGLVSGDFNGDGVADLFESSSGLTTGTILLGNGDGTFRIGYVPTGNNLIATYSYDANGDGILDLIGLNTLENLEVRLGNGDGTFRPATSYNGGGGMGVSSSDVGDINGDGVIDIVMFDGGGNQVVVLGNSDGSFRVPVATSGAPEAFGDVSLTDLNGDGVLDILAGTSGYPFEVALGNQDSSGRRNNLVSNLNLLTSYDARAALTQTTTVLNRINSELGRIGALQSRLGTSVANIQNRRTNYEAAASQIMDVDVAEEAARLTSRRILQQAATAVLGQANQQPKIALTLLGGLKE